ncbi:MAG: 50S ribosomal protein L25/general stress protein Ctc [Rhodanobacteraceae bacterium]|nr:50S ribosomal protein L25/general stress protein Ctc [Rhodanobacteraceae bacterium]
MAKIRNVPVEFRADEGKGASRRLRAAGKVPAILYGGGQAPRALQMDQLLAYRYANNEWFYTSILELDVGNETQKALLRDLQRHPYKPMLLHIDFQRVSETEPVRLRVPLHFLNQATSPAGKTGGSLILHELNDVEISCLPKDLPEFLEVDLADLKIGDTIHVSDIKLPEGVEIPSLKLGREHDVAVVVARMAIEEAAEAPAEGAAQPVPAAGKKPAAAAKAAAPAKAAPAKPAAKK